MITPLNVLEAKALKRQAHETVAGTLAASRRSLSVHRVRALAGLIVGLVEDIARRYARGMVADEENGRALQRLIRAAEEAQLHSRHLPPGTAATGLMDDIARHARRCSDAQDFGRIASISELRALTVKLADAFDLAQVVPPSAPAAPRVAAE